MIHLKTPNGPVVAIYDDVRQLSAARYQHFCAKHLEYSVGTDLFAADGHLGRMALFFTGRDYSAAAEQFNQLVLALHHIQQQHSGPALVLSCLVAAIDETPVLDYSDSALAQLAQRLLATGISQGELQDTLEQAKKRLSENS